MRTAVDEFNAVLPATAPLLVYRPMRPGGCNTAWDRKRGIVVCSVNRLDYVGQSWGRWGRGQIRLADPHIHSGQADNIVCHEFMHVLTGIPDNYDALPESSCVWGSILTAPGPFDVQTLTAASPQKAYGETQRRHKKRR